MADDGERRPMAPDGADDSGPPAAEDPGTQPPHPGKAPGPRAAYRAAGVDVDAGERAVSLFAADVASTRRPEVVGGLGGFGGAFSIPVGYREPLLVASTDGVGTKTALALAVGRLDTLGIDLVAMCADDVVCAGAEPLAFLDYLAVGRLVPERVQEVVAGVAAGCRAAGCALVGGETAEHPGTMAPDDLDLAGTCIGVVERADVLDGAAVRDGDLLVGLAASGLHSNGYSLVRRILDDAGVELGALFGEVAARWDVAVPAADASRTLGEVLLEPTRIYAPLVLAARRAVRAAGPGLDLHGVAHVTGGGLPGNVPRVVPFGLGARVDPARWPLPPVMALLGAMAGLDLAEVRATFNGGVGMVLVVPPSAEALAAVRSAAAEAGCGAWLIGEVVETATLGGARYVEAPLGERARDLGAALAEGGA